MPLANRATIGNMSPEYGSTCAIFPIDEETIRYLRFTGRDEAEVALVEAYAKEQGLWHSPDAEPDYSERLELDLGTIVPSLAGPKRPQDRVALTDAKTGFRAVLGDYVRHRRCTADAHVNGLVDEAVARDVPGQRPGGGRRDRRRGSRPARTT